VAKRLLRRRAGIVSSWLEFVLRRAAFAGIEPEVTVTVK
jgi:hypothetical protein